MTACLAFMVFFYPLLECPPEPEPTVEERLVEAIDRHFPADVDVDLMVKIARCESGLTADAHRTDNPGQQRTGDFGIFQVNAKTWRKALKSAGIAEKMTDLFDLEVGVEAAAMVYRQQGLNAWLPYIGRCLRDRFGYTP